ncbi:MAG: hypothetical protein R3A49_10280 [Acidimicrobiia bacterium]
MTTAVASPPHAGGGEGAAPGPPTVVSAPAPPSTRFSWIHNPALDIALALAWIPFALAAWALLDNRVALNALLAGVFLLSFSHQPLTLAFVYGDPAQFRLKRAIFTWAPFCFIVAALIGRNISLALVAVVAGLWNAEHTLMQRYGVTRIYGRKAGDTHGMLEKLMLISWLVLALVWVAADSRTGGFLQRLDLGATNADGVEILRTLRPWAQWLLVPTIATVLALTVAWLRVEWQRRETANRAKYVYVGSTAALFVVMLINPILGIMGYVAAHAIEYFAIVNQTLGKRYMAQPGGGALGRAVRLPLGRPLFYITYIGIIAAIVFSLKWHGDPTMYAVVYLTLGGMHVFYDGFIWKLRRPEVAGSVGATA